MKPSSRITYLKIAGFRIKLEFQPTDWPANKKRLINEIYSSLGGFIIKQSSNNYNISIRFVDRLDLDILSSKSSAKHFINYYESINNKNIITFYHISIVQLIIILRTVLQNLLADNNGFIFHGSAVLLGRKACLFLGKSGAGKSTILKILADKVMPLADDTIIIRKVNNHYYLYQSPMIDKVDWVRKSTRRYQIGKLYFLHQKNSFFFTKIKDKQRVLKKIIKVFFTDSNHRTSQMQRLMEFISKYDIFYNLYSGINVRKLFNLLLKS